MTKEIENYRKDGFNGFVPVSKLRSTASLLPDSGGVYIVVRDSDNSPEFLATGTGGFFKGKNPNVGLEELESNYVAGSKVVYIGKATSLKKRVGQLLRFGAGSAVGHWGGRYLWQLADSDNLLIAWKTTSTTDPRAEEIKMLEEFVSRHGKLPFANLTM
ncbi:hypothetical protein [Bacteroides acidifaciens]|jgi:hypothetical protein|uniref:hypothetical protein n=1 Tax=Bacteroides acidifaciens TaxID=85831 RepID=UPI002729E29C